MNCIILWDKRLALPLYCASDMVARRIHLVVVDIVNRMWRTSARIIFKRTYTSLASVELMATRFAYEVASPCLVLISDDMEMHRIVAACRDYGAKSIAMTTKELTPADVTLDWHESVAENARCELLEAVRRLTSSSGWADEPAVEAEFARRASANYRDTRQAALRAKDVTRMRGRLRLYKR